MRRPHPSSIFLAVGLAAAATALVASGPLPLGILEEANWRARQAEPPEIGLTMYLRKCSACLHRAEAAAGLDTIQRRIGLVGRLSIGTGSNRRGEGIDEIDLDERGTTIVASGANPPELWDVESGERIRRLRFSEYLNGPSDRNRLGGFIESARWLPGRDLIAGISDAGTLWLWNRSGDSIATIEMAGGNDLLGLAVGPDGRSVAVPAGDRVFWWHEGKPAIEVPIADPDFAAIDQQGELITVSSDSVIRWRIGVEADRRIVELAPPGMLVGLSSRGAKALYANGDTLDVYDTATGLRDRAIGARASVAAGCASDETGTIAAGDDSGNVVVVTPSIEQPVIWAGHAGPVNLVSCSERGPRIVSAARSRLEAKIWDIDRVIRAESQGLPSSPPPVLTAEADLTLTAARLGDRIGLGQWGAGLLDLAVGYGDRLGAIGFFGLALVAIVFMGWRELSRPGRGRGRR